MLAFASIQSLFVHSSYSNGVPWLVRELHMEEVQDGASELPPVVGHGETVTFGHVDVEPVYGRECQAALVALVGSRLSAIGRYLVVSDICCEASDEHRVYPDILVR